MEKKLTNSGPLREPAGKHSICTIKVALGAGQMVMALRLGHLLSSPHRTAVQVQQAPVRCGMRKDHAPAAPIAGSVRPGAWRRIAHAQLLRQRQRNAALLQGGGAPAAGRGSMERGELRRQVWARWGGLR